jgi:hypothetical protein
MSVAHWQREASWSAERQFRFAYETGALGVTRRILSHTRRREIPEKELGKDIEISIGPL